MIHIIMIHILKYNIIIMYQYSYCVLRIIE